MVNFISAAKTRSASRCAWRYGAGELDVTRRHPGFPAIDLSLPATEWRQFASTANFVCSGCG